MPNASRPAVQRVSYVYIISTVPSSLLTHACCPFSSPCLPITQQQCIVEMHMAPVCIRFDIPSHRFAIEIRHSHHYRLFFWFYTVANFGFAAKSVPFIQVFRWITEKKNQIQILFIFLCWWQGRGTSSHKQAAWPHMCRPMHQGCWANNRREGGESRMRRCRRPKSW